MNRATFITTLAGSAFALPHLVAAETPDEKAIYDALDAIVDAQFTYDFARLSSSLHPFSLRLFRDSLSARFDQLLRYFPAESVVSISGLPDHPKDARLSDAEVFIAACNSAKERHPEFVGDPKLLPLTIHGTIFERQKTGYVLFSYSGSVRTERTDFDYVQPTVFNFRRARDQWLLYSCILVPRVIDDWWRDLSKLKEAEQKPK
jgi:hypothetical protein